MPGLSNKQRFETFDWEHTELGPVETWPAEMRAVVRTALESRFPISTGWGPNAIQIYNDAYNPVYADKHPRAFGRPLFETWPEIRDFLEPAIAQVRDTREALWFSAMLLPLAKRDAPEECYFDFSYSPVLDAHGEMIGVMSVAVETTEVTVAARRAGIAELAPRDTGQPALASLSAQLHALLDANPMDAASAALFAIDARSGSPAEALWSVRMPPATVREARPVVAPLGTTSAEILALSLADGPNKRRRAIGIPLRARDGAPIASLLLVPDALVPARSHADFAYRLAERMHAVLHFSQAREQELGSVQRALQDREALYRFLFEHMGDAAFYSATEGSAKAEEIVLAANPAASRMLGYSAEEFTGMQRERLFFDDDPLLAQALDQRASTRTFLGELTLRAKDGQAVPVEIWSRLIGTVDGQSRSVSVARDITQRRAREQERTEQVRFDTMAQLTGGIAHDFNNLLTVILGSLDALQDSLANHPRAQSLLDNALLASERAAALTGQLLSYARRQHLQATTTDLNVYLERTRGLLASALGEINTLVPEPAQSLPACAVDQTQLTTALLNLVVNARHAMPQGGHVTISTGAVVLEPAAIPSGSPLEPGEHVLVRVCDTGIGIPPAVLPRVFEPFFSTRPMGEGAGLGLPMVQGFARQSGGDVRIHSTPGQGSCIELLLPASVSAAASALAPVAPQGAHGQVVLLAEDNPLVREMALRMLSDAGFRGVAASDGEEALRLLEGLPHVDILVTDQLMPGALSGTQLAEAARARRPGLPVLIVTGFDPQADRSRQAPIGYEVLPKPYTKQTLSAAILRNLAH